MICRSATARTSRSSSTGAPSRCAHTPAVAFRPLCPSQMHAAAGGGRCNSGARSCGPVVAVASPALQAASTRRAAAGVRAKAGGSAAASTTQPHLQLATAKLPPTANPKVFAESIYQWAATLTQSGANLPFVHPLKADKTPDGFQISILRRSDKTGGFGSAGNIVASVETAEGVGNVLVVRFYEGEIAQDNRPAGSKPPADRMERLEVVMASLKDVDTVMSTMPQAIRKAAIVSS